MREIKFRGFHNGVLLPSEPLTQSPLHRQWLGKIDVELMQYTGLKDKNGTEIYEGDVLSGHPHGTATVYWCKAYACFETVYLDGESRQLLGNDLEECFDEWQVVGNIHENPEFKTLKT